jgi:protein MpaA
MVLRIWLFCSLLISGCIHESQEETPVSNLTPSKPISASPKPIPAPPAQILLGQSVNGSPITMQFFGVGSQTVFIMGGIHGDEAQSVDLTTNLIALLTANPQLCAGKRVVILRVANPDGYAAKRRVNANGVDLNRNFPATNYKGSRRYGNTASSQPETRAIIAALDQTQPKLIISIHCIDGKRECNNYDGPAEHVAAAMSQFNHYPVEPNIGYPTPGSLGSFAGIDRQIPIITLELPRTGTGEKAWNDNRDALLAAIKAAN